MGVCCIIHVDHCYLISVFFVQLNIRSEKKLYIFVSFSSLACENAPHPLKYKYLCGKVFVLSRKENEKNKI